AAANVKGLTVCTESDAAESVVYERTHRCRFTREQMYGQQHLELAIEAQEFFEEILFVPELLALGHPVLRVVERREDVVHMEDHSSRYVRLDVLELERNVTSELEDMARIHEQQ